MTKKILMTALLILGGIGSSKDTLASKVLQIKGSDTIVNASQVIAEEYMGKTKGARIAVTGGGSGVGISSLINGTADIGMASRDIKASEKEAATAKGLKLKEVVIGYDGITVISNPVNPVKNLTSKDLGRIFRGEVKNWKEFGGSDSEIVILSRDSSSGTHEFFKEHIVREGNIKGSQEYAEKTLYMPSNESIKQEIRANKNAIGYIGMGYMDKSVNGITVDGVSPSLENVAEKKYPIARAIYWYVGDMSNPDVKGIVDYAVSPEGQEIIKEEGFVPVK